MMSEPRKANSNVQAFFDAICVLTEKHRKEQILDLAGQLIDQIEQRRTEFSETRYLVDPRSEALKIIGTAPTNRFERLICAAFYGVLNDLDIAPEIEDSLDRLLAPHERPDGEHSEEYFDHWCDIQHAIEPRIRDALLPFITQEGFGLLLEEIGAANQREAEHIIQEAGR
jgi:hypothetical protein